MDVTSLVYAAAAGGFGGVVYAIKNQLLNKANEASALAHIAYGALAACLAVYFVGLAVPVSPMTAIPAIGIGYVGTEYVAQFVSALASGSPPPAAAKP